jgi:predicted enzyme related to lactoylglutathione lyase
MTSFFCWHELRTSNTDAARRFYSELFGWRFHDADMAPAGKYTSIMVGERGIGGLCATQGGEPPNWSSYVTVDDVDAAAERAKKAGGKVLMGPMEVPTIGRFAILADPQGAVIAAWKDGANHASKPDEPFAPGAVCWNELLTSDPAGAKRWYGEVFGWKGQDMPMPGFTYTLWKDGETDRGGAMKMPAEAGGPPHWLAYAAAKVTSLGGKLCVPPTDIPNIGRFAVFSDPQGAYIALYKSLAK